MNAAAAVGERVSLPELTLTDGRRLAPSAWQGDALVLVFFETTCHFCHAHDQHLQKLSQATRGRGLRVIGAAGDRSVQDVIDYAARLGLRFDITMDPRGELRRRFTARTVSPFTVVLDARGVLREAIPGALSEEDALGLARWGASA